jgi:hypothetical protein
MWLGVMGRTQPAAQHLKKTRVEKFPLPSGFKTYVEHFSLPPQKALLGREKTEEVVGEWLYCYLYPSTARKSLRVSSKAAYLTTLFQLYG